MGCLQSKDEHAQLEPVPDRSQTSPPRAQSKAATTPTVPGSVTSSPLTRRRHLTRTSAPAPAHAPVHAPAHAPTHTPAHAPTPVPAQDTETEIDLEVESDPEAGQHLCTEPQSALHGKLRVDPDSDPDGEPGSSALAPGFMFEAVISELRETSPRRNSMDAVAGREAAIAAVEASQARTLTPEQPPPPPDPRSQDASRDSDDSISSVEADSSSEAGSDLEAEMNNYM